MLNTICILTSNVYITLSNSFRHPGVVKERKMVTRKDMGPRTIKTTTKPFQGDNRHKGMSRLQSDYESGNEKGRKPEA